MTTQAQLSSPLSDIAEQVAECYAVVYPDRPARSKVMQWLNRARRATSGERGLKSTELRAAIEELVDAGLMQASIEGGNGVTAQGPAAMPGTITRFCMAAHERGVAEFLLKEFDNELHRYRSHSYGHLPVNLEQHVRVALIADNFDRFADNELPSHIWRWITEPAARICLERLPEHHRAQACSFALSYLIFSLQPVADFARIYAAVAPGITCQVLTVRAHIFQGEIEKAKELIRILQADKTIAKGTHVECLSMLALIAMLRGDDQEALRSIEAALEAERSGTRKRLIYPDSLCFSLAILSLLRMGTPAALAQFKTLMSARKKLKLESEIDTLFMAGELADDPNAQMGPLYLSGPLSILGVMYSIASRWHQKYQFPEDHAGFRQWLHWLTRQAYHGGYAWALAEMQVVLEATVKDHELLDPDIKELFAETSAETRFQALGMQSLTQLITPMAPWEFSLRELEQLALKSTSAKARSSATGIDKTRRLVWQLRENHSGNVRVTPIEQTLGKKGEWSAGRRVALKRLKKEAGSLSHLLEQDRKASATIVEEPSYGWGGGSPNYLTTERTLFQLVGHPQVLDEDDQPIDVIEQPPELSLTESDGQLLLSFKPDYEGDHYTSRIDAINRRLHVTHFTAAQRRISEAMPGRTLRVPANAGERLQTLLSGLTGDIAVLGDAIVATSASQEGNPETLLAIEPIGSALRVRFRVEPLADSGVYFDAAEGASVVYVHAATGSVAVQRNLNDELTRIHEMVTKSTVLSTHYDGRPHLLLETTIEALELLDETQEADIRCVWPSDVPFRIKARVDIQQVNLSITSGKDWFSASGTLPISDADEDSISIQRLLELMASQRGSRFVELGSGEFLALSRTLRQQLDTLQAFSRTSGSGSAKANKVHPMALLALEPLLEHAHIEGDKAWKKLQQRISTTLQQTPRLPDTLQADLRDYQLEGFCWLARLGSLGAGACLADDMGLGKTVQALAVLLLRASEGPALVVAPTSVVGNWLQEAQRFAPSLNVVSYAGTTVNREHVLESLAPFDVVLISYGLMLNNIEALEKVHWHSLVLDEAQAIRNAATGRAKAAKRLLADFRIATTGTPVQNNLMDLHSLFSFLNPKLLGSEKEFRKRYAMPITHNADAHAREQLQQLVSPFLLRRLKRNVLQELPARTEVTLEVALSKEEALLYESLRRDALDALEQSAEENSVAQQRIVILTYLTKLRRLCCNPTLVSPDWTGPTSKLDVFSDTLSELLAGGHKALVFSQFVGHLKIVERHLKSQGIRYQYLDGSTKASQRTKRVNAFQAGDGDVFLISLTAGGTGLNLTAADYVIHLDPWWNPAVEDQASDRAHRLGQQRPVTILRMITTGTVEEQIQTLHGRKRELADSVLAGADNSVLDAETMMSLFQGSAGDAASI
jgi:superfamily II DNA or RNA helicase